MTDTPRAGRARAARTARVHPAPRPAPGPVRVAQLAALDDQDAPAPAARRTPVRARPLLEDEFAEQVTDLAARRGWAWVHFRPARTKKGWRTAVSGALGVGWPDYTLVRGDRIIFAELKTKRGPVSDAQVAVLAVLRGLVVAGDPRVQVHVWRPADLHGAVADALR